MKYTKELKVGITALTAGIVLYLGLNYLKGIEAFSLDRQYYVHYPTAEELENASPVTLNGVVVGRVSDISLLPKQSHSVKIEISVKKDIVLPQGTVAEMQSSGLLGGKIIALLLPNAGIPLKEGDTLIARIKPTLTDILGESNLSHEISTATTHFSQLLAHLSGSGATISHALGQMDTLMISLNYMVETNQWHLGQSMRQINQATRSLNQAMTQADSLLIELRKGLQHLDPKEINLLVQDMRNTFRSTNLILDSLNQGQGTLGKLMTDEKLYQQLSSSLSHLEALLERLKRRPKDFMAPLGRTEKKIQRKNKRSLGPQDPKSK